MVDKIRPLKIERPSAGGSEDDPFPTEADPTEDYVAAKGISFESSDGHLIDRDAGGELQYKDAVQTTYKKFNDVAGAAAAARYTILLQNNGTVSGGTFLGYDSLIPGDTTPIIIPIESTFKGFSFSNQNADADYTLIFRKNSTGATPFYSISKVNTQFFAQTVTDEPFAQGDRIFVQYQDDGNNASDAVTTLYFQAAF